jgi:hypothetical protein
MPKKTKKYILGWHILESYNSLFSMRVWLLNTVTSVCTGKVGGRPQALASGSTVIHWRSSWLWREADMPYMNTPGLREGSSLFKVKNKHGRQSPTQALSQQCPTTDGANASLFKTKGPFPSRALALSVPPLCLSRFHPCPCWIHSQCVYLVWNFASPLLRHPACLLHLPTHFRVCEATYHFNGIHIFRY